MMDDDAVRRITGADEIRHYDGAASAPEKYLNLARKLDSVASLKGTWFEPPTAWLDSVHDAASQADVYEHVKPAVVGGTVVQVGGTGLAAIKALIGGAEQAQLVTPSEAEAALALRLAGDFGFTGRLQAHVGFAESLPIADASVTAVVSEACLHHTNVSVALREAARVLRPGGRFGAWDPWKARLYDLGIALFGKRDPDVNCRPIDKSRLEGLPIAFPYHSEVRLHGALTRYPGVVWARYAWEFGVGVSLRVTQVDDGVSRRVPALARNGSSCAILGTVDL